MIGENPCCSRLPGERGEFGATFKYKEVAIVEGSVCVDHIHLCVKIPPKLSVSEFMGYLKGKSALMIFDRHPEFRQKGNRHFWAKGYYVNTVGRNEEEIKRYIKDQVEADQIEDNLKKQS